MELMELVNAINALTRTLEKVSLGITEKIIDQFEDLTPSAEPAAEPEPVKSAEPEPVKTIELSDIRPVVADKIHGGYRKEVGELLKKYGAEKISGVQKSDYPAFLKEAEAIGT